MYAVAGAAAALPGFLLVLCLAGAGPAGAADGVVLTSQAVRVGTATRTAVVPEGYRLEVLTEGVRQPRMLSFAAGGELLIGSRSDRVYRLAPPYTEPDILLEADDYPHSVVVREGEILIARTSGLYRAPYEQGQSRIRETEVQLVAPLPGGRGHSSRTVRTGPDGRVYLSLGITGNCSDEYLGESYPFRKRRGGVLVLQEDRESTWQTYAAGLRNPVGFDWHPETGTMYASNNGPDHLGFDLPPEYFVPLAEGSFHGMPWFQFDGEKIVRDGCIAGSPPRPAADVVLPAAVFPARSAPMAVAFVGKGDLEERFYGDAVVALRGSWGTAPRGSWRGDPATRREPKLVLVRFAKGTVRHVADFVTGFQLPDGSRWARPVGAAFGPDGALYFTSDEGAEALFRLRRIAHSRGGAP